MNTPYIEALFDQYLVDPNSVSDEWKKFFNQVTTLENGRKEQSVSHYDVIENETMPDQVVSVASGSDKQEAVDDLIRHFRNIGHLNADFDPLKLHQHVQDPRLQYQTYGLTDADLTKSYLTRGVLKAQTATLKDINDALKAIYTSTVGFQFEYITDPEQRKWLENYIEQKFWIDPLSTETKEKGLNNLIAANGLEQYLEVKYPGQKRFSIEGLDAIIPALSNIIDQAGQAKIKEVVMCMAHRGRLNVMVNVVGKSVTDL